MITYELAKKLKDAGFLQKDHYDEYDNLVQFHQGEEFISIPTLSELIEACGEEFSHLRKNEEDNSWECGVYTFPSGHWTGWGKYSTPEEAVVNLWLELNKK